LISFDVSQRELKFQLDNHPNKDFTENQYKLPIETLILAR